MRGHDGWGRQGDHAGLHWLVMVIVLVLLVGGIVWTVLRLTGRPGRHWVGQLGHVGPPPPPPHLGAWPAAAVPPAPPRDAALEAARLRYANGELPREDYLRIAADLGAPVPPAQPAPPPAG